MFNLCFVVQYLVSFLVFHIIGGGGERELVTFLKLSSC